MVTLGEEQPVGTSIRSIFLDGILFSSASINFIVYSLVGVAFFPFLLAGTSIGPAFLGTETFLPFTVIRFGSEPFGIYIISPSCLEPAGKPDTSSGITGLPSLSTNLNPVYAFPLLFCASPDLLESSGVSVITLPSPGVKSPLAGLYPFILISYAGSLQSNIPCCLVLQLSDIFMPEIGLPFSSTTTPL